MFPSSIPNSKKIKNQEELHRRAYNASFDFYGLKIAGTPLVWSVEYYDILANTVGGGKPKMKFHFGENRWPVGADFFDGAIPNGEDEQNQLVDALQDKKTEFYKEIVASTATARPGVLRLMDEAINDPQIAVGICSAATKAGFEKVVNSVVGPERLSKMDVVMAGDDVVRKKPDPLIYNLAREVLNLPASKCVVIEDSMVGLRAALGANMPCIVTPCPSSDVPDFKAEGASAVMDDKRGLGDGDDTAFTLKQLFPEGADVPNFEFSGMATAKS
jgi:HAD superfamily hydrolase (TIGR01509 family)